MDDLLVTVCNCSNIGDAQTIRASLEARGVPTLIDGEDQRNVLGLFGSGVALRIMVPRSHLRLAYELAREIIEDLPEPSFHDDEDDGEIAPREPMPQRRALPEDLVAYPDDEDQGDELDDDVDDDVDELDDDIDELRDQPTLFVPRVSFGLGMAAAIGLLAFGYITQGLIAAAILLGLVYLRVLPLTSNEPK